MNLFTVPIGITDTYTIINYDTLCIKIIFDEIKIILYYHTKLSYLMSFHIVLNTFNKIKPWHVYFMIVNNNLYLHTNVFT